MTAQHEKAGGYQLLTPPNRTGEPSSSDYARTFRPDIIAALRLPSEMINERSKLRPLGSKQGFPVKGRTQYLVGCAHAPSMGRQPAGRCALLSPSQSRRGRTTSGFRRTADQSPSRAPHRIGEDLEPASREAKGAESLMDLRPRGVNRQAHTDSVGCCVLGSNRPHGSGQHVRTFRIGKSIGPGEGGVVCLGSPGPQATRGYAMINHRTWKRRAVIM